MRPIRTIKLALVLCLLTLNAAHARCEGAAMLGQLHDAYLATLIEKGETRINSARTLLVIVGGKNASSLSRQLRKSGIEASEDRILEVMQEGAKFAQNILMRIPLDSDLFQHSRNVDWLAAIVHRAKCQNGVVVASSKAAARSMGTGTLTFHKPSKGSLPIFATSVIGLLAALSILARLIVNSHFYRARKTARLPRSSFSMEFNLTITDQNGDMQQTKATGVDLSVGGMKLDWPDGPPPGTTVTVSLPFGERLASVMWSNAFFAGIMFDDHLSKKEMAAIQGNSDAQKKTAPEGAASEVPA